MSILSKRIAVKQLNISDDGINHGDIDRIFELNPKSLILREVKTVHTSIIKEFVLPECQTDIFLSTEAKHSGVGGAIVGGLAFGLVGATIGVLSERGKPIWVFEIVEDGKPLLFKLRNDTDKKTLEKYLKKRSSL